MKRSDGSAALAVLDRNLIDAQSPAPLYFQLFTVLNDAINRGLIPNGARMPSEKEISDCFDVSRITARRTLAELATKGLVVRHRGKGTFVQHGYSSEQIVAPLGALTESLGDLGRDTTLAVLSKRMAMLPPELQQAFGLPEGTKVCQLVRLRSHRGRPLAHYVSWTPMFKASMPRRELEGASRVTLFEKYGLRIARMSRFLSAEGAAPDVARALGVSSGKPLLKLVRWSYDAEGRLQDHLTALYNTDVFSYKVETRVGLD
ncbi:MAG: GntR family transcriptional regulator [Steroidobacteraceae bacterium]|nr:GntR family transcriptional regulator [Steroidobacteraceae bacterium]